jgi:hypothetical protein
LLSVCVHQWYLLLARGLVSIAFAMFLLFLSHLTISAITSLFGIYTFVDGSLAFALAVKMMSSMPKWSMTGRPESVDALLVPSASSIVVIQATLIRAVSGAVHAATFPESRTVTTGHAA